MKTVFVHSEAGEWEYKRGFAFMYSSWPRRARVCELESLEFVQSIFTLTPIDALVISIPENLEALLQNKHHVQIYRCHYAHDDTPYLILVSQEMKKPVYGPGFLDSLTNLIHPTYSTSPAEIVKNILELCHGDIIAMQHLGAFVVQEFFGSMPLHADCMRLALSLLPTPRTVVFQNLPRKMPPLEPCTPKQ